ncbi:MAG TPA: hypothetical protein PK295_04030 [Candidatus Magasanikbacteria bacterium]|nr:hypothetical protein [Candidatus Magasanikbacteria bacterium]
MDTGVHRLHTIEIQARKFNALLSAPAELNYGAVDVQAALPSKAEGWYVIPRWQAVGPTYRKAVEIAFEWLIVNRPDTIDYKWVDLKNACQHPRTARIMGQIYHAQQTDLLLVPAQLGIHYSGWSVQKVQRKFVDPEFGLDTFSVACMLAVHPGRMIPLDPANPLHSKWINCPGDGNLEGAGMFFMNPTLGYLLSFRGDEDPIDVGSATAWRPIPRGKSW